MFIARFTACARFAAHGGAAQSADSQSRVIGLQRHAGDGQVLPSPQGIGLHALGGTQGPQQPTTVLTSPSAQGGGSESQGAVRTSQFQVQQSSGRGLSAGPTHERPSRLGWAPSQRPPMPALILLLLHHPHIQKEL